MANDKPPRPDGKEPDPAAQDGGKAENVTVESQSSVFSSLKNYAARLTGQTPATAPTILIVDDEEPVLKFVERVLREAGYKTAVASGGPEALDVAAKLGSFDVLVTDVMMPRMTGDELARRIRQTEPKIKVLYLTGYSDRLFKEKATLWADEAFLDKPCTVKGLREAVSLLLYGRLDAPTE